MFLAERVEIGGRRELILLGNLGKRQVGHHDVAQDVFRAAGNQPLLRLRVKRFLEPTVEGAQTEVGLFCKLRNAVHVFVMGKDKFLEVDVLAHQGVEKDGQRFLCIIHAQVNQQFVTLQLVVVLAPHPVFEAPR